jgi:ActR/RegA family two-component response regulator
MKPKNKPRALVVDDEPVWLDTLADLVEEEGFAVSKASTRLDAEQFLNTYIYDIAIMDVNLTDAPTDVKGEPMDQQGMELITAIRRFARKKEMAIVIVTGYGTPDITRNAFKSLGVQDILFKRSFKAVEFRAVVKEATADIYLKREGYDEELFEQG